MWAWWHRHSQTGFCTKGKGVLHNKKCRFLSTETKLLSPKFQQWLQFFFHRFGRSIYILLFSWCMCKFYEEKRRGLVVCEGCFKLLLKTLHSCSILSFSSLAQPLQPSFSARPRGLSPAGLACFCITRRKRKSRARFEGQLPSSSKARPGSLSSSYIAGPNSVLAGSVRQLLGLYRRPPHKRPQLGLDEDCPQLLLRLLLLLLLSGLLGSLAFAHRVKSQPCCCC